MIQFVPHVFGCVGQKNLARRLHYLTSRKRIGKNEKKKRVERDKGRVKMSGKTAKKSTGLEAYERCYRPTEVARLLDVSLSTIYRMLGDGRLRGIRLGRTVRVPESAIREVLGAREA